jgi:plasmid maintenance system antidote protein VapI
MTSITKEQLLFLISFLGLSQAEFARQVGTTPQTVSRLVNGRRPLTPQFIGRLWVALGPELMFVATETKHEPEDQR